MIRNLTILFLSIYLLIGISLGGNIKNQFVITDSSFSVFRETQLGLNLINTGGNHYYHYSTKLGAQMNFLLTGLCIEHEYNFTKEYNESVIQRNRSYGLFFGFEIPLGKQFKLGIIQSGSTYNKNIERPIYYDNSLGLFSSLNIVLFQTQLRTLYRLNKNFSVLTAAYINLINNNAGNIVYNKGSNIGVSLGIRYAFYGDYEKQGNTNKPIRLFAGTQLEWEKTDFNNIIGFERALSNQEVLNLAKIGSSTSKTFTMPLLGILDKRNNMLIFGFNQRHYKQFEDYLGFTRNASNWKLDFNHVSSRIALEFNIFNCFGKRFEETHHDIYPFYRVSGTYSTKNINITNGWAPFYTSVNDTVYYIPEINSKTKVQSFDIDNSLGLAMKLNNLYISVGLNILNHKYSMVQFEKSVTKNYYSNNNPYSVIKEETATDPIIESEGWLKTKRNNMNFFFSLGLVF